MVEGASDSRLRFRRGRIVESDAPSTAQVRGPPSPLARGRRQMRWLFDNGIFCLGDGPGCELTFAGVRFSLSRCVDAKVIFARKIAHMDSDGWG
jgi:hypothetical protein